MIKIIKTLLLMLFSFNVFGETEKVPIKTIYDITFLSIDEKTPINLKDYTGKLIIVANTASLCGFTGQYAALQELWSKYQSRGLVIIGVPSNNFGDQEPAGNAEIHSFCTAKFSITFPLTTKVDVTGENSHPFFALTRSHFGKVSGPNWNFYKYIISPEGKLLTWYSSFTEPNSEKFISFIEANLPR